MVQDRSKDEDSEGPYARAAQIVPQPSGPRKTESMQKSKSPVLPPRHVMNHHIVQLLVLLAILSLCSVTARIGQSQSTVVLTALSTKTTSPPTTLHVDTSCSDVDHRLIGLTYSSTTGCAVTNLLACGRSCDIVTILCSLATADDVFVQDANVTLNATAFAEWRDAYDAGKLSGNYFFLSDNYQDYDNIRYYLYSRTITQQFVDWIDARLDTLSKIHVSQTANGYEVDTAVMAKWSVRGSYLAGLVRRTSEDHLVFNLQENGVTGQYVIDGEIPNYVLLKWGQELVSNHLSPMKWDAVRGMTTACASTNANLPGIRLRELVAEHHWNSNLLLGAKQICPNGWTLSVNHELDYNSLPYSGFGLAPEWPLTVFNISYYDNKPHDYLSRLPLSAINDRFTQDKVILNDRAHKVFNAVLNVSSVELPPYHSYVVMTNSSYGSITYSTMYVVEYETCNIFIPVLQEIANVFAFVTAYGFSSFYVSYSFVFDHRTPVAIQGVQLAYQIWYYYTGKYELYSMTGMGSLGSMRFVGLCVMCSVTAARLALYTFAGSASNWTLRSVIYLMMIANVAQFTFKDPSYNVVFSVAVTSVAVVTAMIVTALNRRQRINNCICTEFKNVPRLIPGRFDDVFQLEDPISLMTGRQLAVRGILASADGKCLYPCECVYMASTCSMMGMVGMRVDDRRFFQPSVRVAERHAHGLHYSMPMKTSIPAPEVLIGAAVEQKCEQRPK